jgi:hypothetical protein
MRLRTDLAIEEADGELIVLDKPAGKVHQLNASASFICYCLNEGLSMEQIFDEVSRTFKIELGAAKSDVDTAVAQLIGLGLIVE